MIPVAAIALSAVFSHALSGVSVGFDASTGTYAIDDLSTHWQFAGKVPGPSQLIGKGSGRDHIGAFREISFEWNESGRVRGSIRAYDETPVVWFRAHYLDGRHGNGVVFPNFDKFPPNLSWLSFRDQPFSAPTTALAQTSTPWVAYDAKRQALIFSPASAFLVAKMTGDKDSSIGAGLNLRLGAVPNGFDQDSILALGGGIGETWNTWGAALRHLYGRPDVRYDADVLLRSFGYWTDNGADYYYNYDRDKGYADTLLAVSKRYDQEGIPLCYLQLDSWWYSKTTNDPAGRPGGPKNPRLPEGSWNRYGGLLEYRAHPDLFTHGLDGFHAALGLPLAVHNRWIDRTSPYHARYDISGVGAVDPKWWTDIVGYLKAGGVATYEQDWLSAIYANSPDMASRVGVGDRFTDGMARASSDAGLTMQYCMATPRFFLQGVKYPNLTTIRTSGDRFEPRKWADFLFVSQLAVATGVAPWCDVFKSSETGNLILAVLSCGPVGTGDAIGKEDVANIRRAVRADGLIVKPDRAILPTDASWEYLVPSSRGGPGYFAASTFTRHSAMRTTYAFAFPRDGQALARVDPRTLGIDRETYAVDLTTKLGVWLLPGDLASMAYTGGNYAYWMFAPITACGIVFLGDLDMIVPTGKQRIADVTDKRNGLRITVHFAKTERRIRLSGVSTYLPLARGIAGKVTTARFVTDSSHIDNYPDARRFEVDVEPPAPGRDAVIWLGKGATPN